VSIAYVDTSVLVAIAFDEPDGDQARERLDDFSRLLSANLLDAELRAAFARERLEFDAAVLSRIEWVLPDRPLGIELVRVLHAGYLRGADLWHIATALYVAPGAEEIGVFTLDGPQRKVASILGFQVETGRRPWPT
jgi:predicted nucleic acid-binding protein